MREGVCWEPKNKISDSDVVYTLWDEAAVVHVICGAVAVCVLI